MTTMLLLAIIALLCGAIAYAHLKGVDPVWVLRTAWEDARRAWAAWRARRRT